ncbi:Trm112 family protein [Lysobacter sp. CAU 1642]|uniref:Trm112 family protein n=1 Tax=Pseudomarimonas salicorniae TaxID=2933270 RepID=A0ABT0GIF5_9GAMM|nr:Trm112 family protein [Lysobacter sp. CAU 1642]MCK7594331.1 Trm112 family protein [Lysobacter sp. CAU 1642]
MDKRLLDILCCPESKQPVSLLAGRQLDTLNQGLAAGSLKLVDGSPASGPLKAALITADAQRVYRIEDGIPVMLVDQAIDVRGLDGLR